MAEDISELVVRVHPEGMSETTRELDKVQNKFEDTSEDVEDSTSQMTSFSKKFRGAGLVFGAAFGGMVGAIASRMPILKETFSAFDILLTSFGLKLSQDTRPALDNVNQGMIDFADHVNDSDNTLDIFTRDLETAKKTLHGTGGGGGLNLALGDVTESFSGWNFQMVRGDGLLGDIIDRIEGLIDSLMNLRLNMPGGGGGGGGSGPVSTGGPPPETTTSSRPSVGTGMPDPTGFNRGPGPDIIGFGGRSATSDVPGENPNSAIFEGRTEINIDGRTVATQVKRHQITGVLSSGRGTHLR